MNQRRQHRLTIESLESRHLLTAVCSDGRDAFTVGLIDCTSDAYEGYTLLAPDRSNDAFLLDVHGREVHRWEDGPYPGRRGSYLGPDGSLYSTGVVNGTAQAAGGVTGALYAQDWDGNLTWQFEYEIDQYTMHHDIEIMPNGNILAFAWIPYSTSELVALGREPGTVFNGELWGEKIIELQPTGPTTADVVWEWNLIDHVVQDFDPTKPNFGVIADNPHRFDINLGRTNTSDWVHFNAIDYNPQLDQIVVNSPFMGEFWVIDHSTTTAEAATSSGGNSGMGGDFLYRWGNPANYGVPGSPQLFNQHDAQWIDPGNPGAGNFLVFNNQSNPTSTIFEIVPPVDLNGNYDLVAGQAYGPAGPTWVGDTGVNAGFISGAHRLPNGNTLFVHGPDGLIGELTNANEQVWNYVSPVSFNGIANQGAAPAFDNVFKSRRYAPEFEAFDGRDISPTGYVENWTVGDYNLDGSLDGADVDALCQGLSSGDMIYDVNFDNQLDAADVEHMVIDLMGFSVGDANFDGAVDGQDFLSWNANKFQPSNLYSEGDFNCDGFVDGQDFLIWNANKFNSGAMIVAKAIEPAADSSREVDNRFPRQRVDDPPHVSPAPTNSPEPHNDRQLSLISFDSGRPTNTDRLTPQADAESLKEELKLNSDLRFVFGD